MYVLVGCQAVLLGVFGASARGKVRRAGLVESVRDLRLVPEHLTVPVAMVTVGGGRCGLGMGGRRAGPGGLVVAVAAGLVGAVVLVFFDDLRLCRCPLVSWRRPGPRRMRR